MIEGMGGAGGTIVYEKLIYKSCECGIVASVPEISKSIFQFGFYQEGHFIQKCKCGRSWVRE